MNMDSKCFAHGHGCVQTYCSAQAGFTQALLALWFKQTMTTSHFDRIMLDAQTLLGHSYVILVFALRDSRIPQRGYLILNGATQCLGRNHAVTALVILAPSQEHATTKD